MRRRIIPFFVPHLGCPNDCVFCNQRHISGNISAPSPDDVRRGISAALEKTGPGAEVAFYGGSFTAIDVSLQEALLGAVKDFIGSGAVSGIRVSTRPDCIDDISLIRLQKAGVDTIELGAQSLDDEVLRLSARGHTAQHVSMASEKIKAMGFSLVLQMMTGLPGDSLEKSIITARRICAMRPNAVRIYPTVIVKDTALERLWREGKYEPHTVEEAVSWCAELIGIFEEQGVEIIRLGLNPTDDLSSGEALAGAYHPALGELARSRKYLNDIITLISRSPVEGSRLFIHCPERDVSKVTGQKRCNINALKQRFGFAEIKVIPDPECEKTYISYA